MNLDDQVLKDVSGLLAENNINFWVCHGTLLGIIRENRLLPWDRDIDVAVWDHETDRDKVAAIFESKGYKQEVFYADVDSLHFHRGEKNIDINFFKQHNDTSSWQGAIAKDGLFNKLIIHFAHIVNLNDLKQIEFPKNIIKKFFFVFFVFFVLFSRIFFPIYLKKKIQASGIKRIRYIGYSYPTYLLKFKKINYKGMILQVPINSEKCLELTYGTNWKIPKKNYIWHEDATNLITR